MTAKRPREGGEEAAGPGDAEDAASLAAAAATNDAEERRDGDGDGDGDAEREAEAVEGAEQPKKRQRAAGGGEGPGGVDPGGGGGEDEDDAMIRRAFKRNDAVAARIKLLMVKVGQGALKTEAAKKLEGQLCMLAGALEKDVEHHGDVIVAALVECGCSFGWKAPVYGTLAGLLATSVQTSAARCAEKRLLRCVRGDAQYPSQGAVVLRLLCEMANAHVVAVGPLLQTMTTLIDGGRAWMVVRALPWLRLARKDEAPSPPDQATDPDSAGALEGLMSRLDALPEEHAPGWQDARLLLQGEERTDSGLLLRPYEIEGVRTALAHASASDAPAHLKTLAAQLGDALAEVQPVPQQLDVRLFSLAGEKVMAHQAKHMHDGVMLLDMEQEDAKSGLQLAREAVVDGLEPQVRWAIRQFVEELLHAYYPYVDEAVEGLLEFCEGRKYDYFLFESALNVLGQGTGNAMFVQRILVELCKLRLGSRRRKRFAPVAEDAVDAIMVLAPTLPPGVLDAFTNWFAFHLSVASPQWPFGKWDQLAALLRETASGENGKKEDAMENGPDADRNLNGGVHSATLVRCAFLRRALEIHANLSLRDHLLETVTPALRDNFLVAERRPNSRFLPETGAPTLQGLGAADVADFVRQKPEEDEFRQWFLVKAEKLSKEDRAECLLHGVLLAGQPTFTHTTRALERVLPVLKEVFAESGLADVDLARAAHVFWKSSTQWAAFVMYTLVRLKLVSGVAVFMYCLALLDAGDAQEPRNGVEWVFPLMQGLVDASTGVNAESGATEQTKEMLKNASEKRDALAAVADTRNKERLDRFLVRNAGSA